MGDSWPTCTRSSVTSVPRSTYAANTPASRAGVLSHLSSVRRRPRDVPHPVVDPPHDRPASGTSPSLLERSPSPEGCVPAGICPASRDAIRAVPRRLCEVPRSICAVPGRLWRAGDWVMSAVPRRLWPGG